MPRSKNLYAALAWLLITTLLLCLPGNNLPQPGGNWFEQLYADKWIHVFIFALLTWLWCRAALANSASTTGNRLFVIAILCCSYGILMEFVQKWLIPKRGFEVWDIAADAAGCIFGWWLARKIKG